MMQRKQLSPEQAYEKAKYYCAYQERSHGEAKEKLYSFGIRKEQVELLLSRLIEEDYLNEERFAIQFAGGKFRMKQWGKKKIEQGLKEKQVSSYCIKKALAQIRDTDYKDTLEKLASRKWEELRKERNIFIKMRKLQDYLLQKGYEYEWVKEFIKKIKDR
ncbi:RecX family transcriptional regulator [Terrimonas sp.]|uniref:regulatory protein RecX n=1 Tax=Terrimonas sp. TaxID=1914338 RepID=UPI000D51E78A|nr:RecX family transcriptional regulator [Terrimonas sp.]PVD51098.1 RecX family transcriptional regulator [Terrimonas sp.]